MLRPYIANISPHYINNTFKLLLELTYKDVLIVKDMFILFKSSDKVEDIYKMFTKNNIHANYVLIQEIDNNLRATLPVRAALWINKIDNERTSNKKMNRNKIDIDKLIGLNNVKTYISKLEKFLIIG